MLNCYANTWYSTNIQIQEMKIWTTCYFSKELKSLNLINGWHVLFLDLHCYRDKMHIVFRPAIWRILKCMNSIQHVQTTTITGYIWKEMEFPSKRSFNFCLLTLSLLSRHFSFKVCLYMKKVQRPSWLP